MPSWQEQLSIALSVFLIPNSCIRDVLSISSSRSQILMHLGMLFYDNSPILVLFIGCIINQNGGGIYVQVRNFKSIFQSKFLLEMYCKISSRFHSCGSCSVNFLNVLE